MIKYVEYLETNGTEAGWNLNEGLTASTDILYFDFMPLSGSVNYDAFWVFIDASADGPSVRCSVTNRRMLQFGTSEMNYANKTINLGERYNCVFGSAITVNNEVVKASSSNGGGAIYVNCWAWGTANNNYRSQRARYYGLKITDSNGNVFREWKPCENTTNNTVGFYETVTDTYIAQIGSGTTTIGPYLSTISVDSDIKAVPASGGTINITVDSESNWSAATTDMSVTVTDYFDPNVQGSSVYYLSAITQNYPSVGTFNLLQVYIPSSPEAGYVTVFLEDGVLHYRETEVWGGSSTITIHDNYVITFFGALSNLTWKPLEDYYKPSDLLTFSTAGTPSDTAITITIPSTTATTQKEATIYFINEVGDKDQLTIKQRKYSAGGIRLIDIGESEVETFYIGNDEVELIYMGEEIVYQKGQGPTPTPTYQYECRVYDNDNSTSYLVTKENCPVYGFTHNSPIRFFISNFGGRDEIAIAKLHHPSEASNLFRYLYVYTDGRIGFGTPNDITVINVGNGAVIGEYSVTNTSNYVEITGGYVPRITIEDLY